MKAAVLTGRGGPEMLKTMEVEPFQGPLPPGAIRVRTTVIGVNGNEIMARLGNRTYNPTGKAPQTYNAVFGEPPYVPGAEGAGTVVELGSPESSFRLGDRVVWGVAQLYKPFTGSYAEECVLNEEAVFKIPAHVSDEQAVGLCRQGTTAHFLATDVYRIQPGDYAVVTGAAGGMGTTLTQIIRRLGGKVIGVVSRPGKVEAARVAGAEHVIVGYDEFGDQVRALIGGAPPLGARRTDKSEAGAAVIYDVLGGRRVQEGFKFLRVRGWMVPYAQLEAPMEPISPWEMIERGSLNLSCPTGIDFVMPREKWLSRLDDIYTWVEDGSLSAVIGPRFSLDEAWKAHAAFESREVSGKVLIVP